MKKAMTFCAAAGIAGVASIGANARFGPVGESISAESTFAFESEYSFRGVKLAGPSLQPGVEVGIFDGYLGAWTSMPLERTPLNGNEVNFYGGYLVPVNEMVTLDAGYTYYWYPQDGGKDSEPYLGLSLDALLDPTFYVFYELENEVTTLEGTAGYSYDLAAHGVWNTSLDIGGFLGYVFNGDDYFYYGATADLVYSVNEAVALSAGVRFAGNDGIADPEQQLWWGSAVAVGF